MSCRVVVDVGWGEVFVVVVWSVQWFWRVDEGVCFRCYSECVEIDDAEDAAFCHEWFGVCPGWRICDLLLCSDEGLYVHFLVVGCAPDGDVADEMWEDVCEVGVSQDVCWEEFVRVSDALDDGLQFLNDVFDRLVVFEVVLYCNA